MFKEDIAAKMKALVKQYQQSGQSRKVFASSHGISESKLTYWIQKFSKGVGKIKKSPSSVNFVPLEVPPASSHTGDHLVIRLRSGVEIEIPL